MDVKSLAELYEYNDFVINANSEGITNEDSLVQPQAAGNCMNWVLGHIVRYRNDILLHAGAEPILGAERAAAYDTGSRPVTAADEVEPFEALLAAFRESQERLVARFNAMTKEALGRDAADPDAPGKTVGQMLAGLMFHEAYHAGQLGLLRRLIGRGGALR